jgi:hypothetical protein
MPKFDLSTVNEVVEADGIPQFDRYIKKGYKLLSIRVHADADGKGNISSCTIFTMGKFTQP